MWLFEVFMQTCFKAVMFFFQIVFSDDDFTRIFTHLGAKKDDTLQSVTHTWTVLSFTVLREDTTVTPRVAGIVAPRIDHWWTKPSIYDPEHIRVTDTLPFLMAKASTFLSVG
jgi:hypothetical protein